ncbi:hypothetical protein ACFL2Z_04980 [Candidatus Eisenbacteria bacterium]|uniref:Uncharacterized protein n=1 Tax=Eiseniibacteriota bacterium TaxID=2212470 RepID=A0ABV6YQQ8_UNCEI
MAGCYRAVLVFSLFMALTFPVSALEIDQMEIIDGQIKALDESAPLDCCATTVYQNTGGANIRLGGSCRWNWMDDGEFPQGTAPVSVSCFKFVFAMADTGRAIVFLDFWDTLVPGGPVCNLSYIGGFGFDFGVLPAGAYSYSFIGGPLTFPDDHWLCQMTFWESTDPWAPSQYGRVGFNMDPPQIGYNDRVRFYLDDNQNEVFECPTETFTLGDDLDAQFYLELGADVGPSANKSTNWGAIKALYR